MSIAPPRTAKPSAPGRLGTLARVFPEDPKWIVLATRDRPAASQPSPERRHDDDLDTNEHMFD
jgi:hypothetical protein